MREPDGGVCSLAARLYNPGRKLIQDLGVTTSKALQVYRRPQWRGERKAVLVRMPVEVAQELTSAAAREQRSVSDYVAGLISDAMAGGRQ